MLSWYAWVPTSNGLGGSEPRLGAGEDDEVSGEAVPPVPSVPLLGGVLGEEVSEPPDGEEDEGPPMSGALRPESPPLELGEVLEPDESPDELPPFEGELDEPDELLEPGELLDELPSLDDELLLDGESPEDESLELDELDELSLPELDELSPPSPPSPPLRPWRAPCPAREPAPSRSDSPNVEPEFSSALLPSS